MTRFFRFPRTPHLAWLGEGHPRADKLLPPDEAASFLKREVVVEEKIDGANLGLSTDEEGEILAQNRGSWLSPGSAPLQFRELWAWLAPRRAALVDALWPDLLLFGEWCVVVHSLRYDALPDWFLGFDVYDRRAGRFWSTRRRDELLHRLGLHPVPRLGRGRFTLDELVAMMGESSVGSTPMEGLYLRHESEDWLQARAKLVRPAFVQAMDAHWSRGPLERNRLATRNPPLSSGSTVPGRVRTGAWKGEG